MFILKVVSVLDDYKIPYAIAGGHAVALHGAIRGTVDINLLIQWKLENLKLVQRALGEIGLQSRLPVSPEDIFHSRDEYIKEKNLMTWNFINPDDPSEQVDVLIISDLGDISVEKTSLEGKTLNIISKKDLIAMKEASRREQDLWDVKALRLLDET